MNIILKDIDPDDFVFASRAARWLMQKVLKDAIVSYGEGNDAKDFYVRRNKRGITVRPTNRAATV